MKKIKFKIQCINCHKIVYVCASRRNNAKYCNLKCVGEYKSKIHRKFITCAICGNKKSVTLSSIKKGSKYCGLKCLAKSLKKKKIKKKCQICNKEIITYPCQAERKKYCSISCRHKGTGIANASKIFVKRVKINCKYCGKILWIKNTDKIKKYCNNNCKRNWMKEYWKSPCNGLWWKEGTKHPQLTKSGRDSLSKKYTQRIIDNGGINPTFKNIHKGFFQSRKNKSKLKYDSSWELQAYSILEQMNEVTSYSRCDFYVEYKWKDNIHRYIPDIKVIYKSGNVDIIEVKPLHILLKNEQIKCKGQAADKYCKNRNMNYIVWTENVVKRDI